MNLYEIREKALRKRRAVYSTQQLANLIGKDANSARAYASRLVRKGLALRLMNGKISFSDDEKVMATQLIEPSCISLHFALLFHQIIQQVPESIACITPKTSRVFQKIGIRYHKIPPKLMFGFKQYDSGHSYYWLADPEKALLDALYLNQFSAEWAKEILPKLNKKKFNAYLKRFPNRFQEKWRKNI